MTATELTAAIPGCGRGVADHAFGLPQFADIGGGDVRRDAAETVGHEIRDGSDLGIGIGLAERRHEHLALRGRKVDALQYRQDHIGRGRVGDAAIADEVRVLPDRALAVKAVTAGAGALEDALPRARAAAGDERQRRLRRRRRPGHRGRVVALGTRRNALDVGCHRLDVVGCQKTQAVADRRAHRPAGRAAFGRMAVGEISAELLIRPTADAPFAIGADVVGLPLVDHRAAEFPALIGGHRQVGRGVAIVAMAQRLG
jgi:hypothetical protein